MPLAIFGISSGGLSIFVNLLVLFLVLVYFALIYWTYLDAKRRIEDPVLVACATAASIFPFVGTTIYTILRPPEFLEDVRERELEIRAAELRVRELIEQSCPYCEYPIERSFLRCPNCERKLKAPCRNCGKPLDPKWGVCPFCETEVRRQKQARPGAERRPTRQARTQRAARTARPASRSGAPASQRAESQRQGQRPAPGTQGARPQDAGSQRAGAPAGAGSSGRRPTRTAAERVEDRRQGRSWRERSWHEP